MAAVSDTYTAEVRWEDGQWQASVRDLAGAHTHAKTMTALRKRLREVIVLMDDRPDSDLQSEEAFSVDLVIDLTLQDDLAVEVNDSSSAELAAPAALGSTAPAAGPAAVTMAAPAATGPIGIFSPSVITTTRPDQALRQAAEARRRAAEAEAEAEHATAIAVLMAQRAGISMRDAAILLGISFQRVQQIAAAASARMLTDSSP